MSTVRRAQKTSRSEVTLIDPMRVFRQALRFRASIHVLHQHALDTWIAPAEQGDVTYHGITERPPTLIVAVTLEPFCLELLLKTICLIEGQLPPDTHKPDVLFKNLPRPWKDRLRAGYTDGLTRFKQAPGFPPVPDSLDETLKSTSDSFEFWRYAFDRELPPTYLFAAVETTITEILKARPEWWDLYKQLIPPRAFPNA